MRHVIGCRVGSLCKVVARVALAESLFRMTRVAGPLLQAKQAAALLAPYTPGFAMLSLLQARMLLPCRGFWLCMVHEIGSGAARCDDVLKGTNKRGLRSTTEYGSATTRY